MTEKTDPILIGLTKISNFLFRLSARIRHWADNVNYLVFKQKFGERDDDIYIQTYPKSGTTLMQVILHQLLTDGNTDFNHIYEVSPWIRNASYRREKVPDLPSPRIIKSHDEYKKFPKETKGRFVFIYRNVEDVAISLFHQSKNYNKPDLELNDFLEKKFSKKTKLNWFKFNQKWLENKKKHKILFLRYEDIIADKMSAINQLIDFLNISPSEEAIDRAIERSSFDYMKNMESKFGLQPPTSPPEKIFSEFIRKGVAGEGQKTLSEEQRLNIDKLYRKKVAALESKVFKNNSRS